MPGRYSYACHWETYKAVDVRKAWHVLFMPWRVFRSIRAAKDNIGLEGVRACRVQLFMERGLVGVCVTGYSRRVLIGTHGHPVDLVEKALARQRRCEAVAQIDGRRMSLLSAVRAELARMACRHEDVEHDEVCPRCGTPVDMGL